MKQWIKYQVLNIDPNVYYRHYSILDVFVCWINTIPKSCFCLSKCNKFAGLLAPVFGLGILVTDTLQDHHDRLVGCTLVLVCQNILISCHFFSLFFSLVFRMTLICFSDRGLVVKGRPQILLFNKLYWTVLGAFFFMGVFLYNLSHVRGTFEDSVEARICMLKTVEQRENNVTLKNKAIAMFFIFLAMTYNKLLCSKVHKYISRICPTGRMAAIGKYRRNLIDFQDNSRYIYCWGLVVIMNLSIRLLDVSPKTRFWMNRSTGLIVIWFVHGLVLPLSMETPWKSKRDNMPASFYVHKPQLPFMYPPPTPVPPQSPMLGLLKNSPTLNFSSTSIIDDTSKSRLEALTITQNAHQVWKTQNSSQIVETEPCSTENCAENSSLPPPPFQSSQFLPTRKFTRHIFQQEESGLPGVET